MKLQDALKDVAQNSRSRRYRKFASRFLYHQDTPGIAICDEARRILANPRLCSDDFDLILHSGVNNIALGNSQTIFKLSMVDVETDIHYDEKEGAIAIKDIPPGLAADIFDVGKCGAVKYQIGKRIDTSRLPDAREAICYLFKARNKGAVYADALPDNFGYDEGVLKVLDHEHFKIVTHENFSSALKRALDKYGDAITYPLIFSDQAYTYIAFDQRRYDNNMKTEEYKTSKKTLLDVLNAVGISDANTEIEHDLPVIRIACAKVALGFPPEEQKLADFLRAQLPEPLCVAHENLQEEFRKRAEQHREQLRQLKLR